MRSSAALRGVVSGDWALVEEDVWPGDVEDVLAVDDVSPVVALGALGLLDCAGV